MWCYGATSIPRGVGSWPNGAVRGCFHFPHPDTVLSAEGKIIIETTASTVFQHSTYLNSRSIKSTCTQYFSVLRTRTLHARSGLKKRILYSGHSAKTWNYSKILSILILILLLIEPYQVHAIIIVASVALAPTHRAPTQLPAGIEVHF